MSDLPKSGVGHLPDQHQLDVVYAGETTIGKVERIEAPRAEHSQPRPFIEKLLGDWSVALSRISGRVGWDPVSRC